jgi:signal transduction histidine kinase/ligand-binding sensor domain-containing protein
VTRLKAPPIFAAVLALGSVPPGEALDPARAMTQYSHVVWQEKNGLPSDMVGAVLQTRDGYLWFGTLNGLARFDGVRFTSFDPLRAQAPFLHRIYSLYEGHDGALWAGSRGGLTRYKDGRFESFPMPDGFRQTGIRTIAEDGAGTLWARTLRDLFRLQDGRLEMVSTDARSLEVGGDGAVRITTQDGLGRIERGRIVLGQRAPTVPGEAVPFALVAAVLSDDDGTTWVGAPWGLGRLGADGHWIVFTGASGLPSTGVTALLRDRHGTLWVGTTRGLARFKGGQPAAEVHELMGHRVLTIYEDREGSLWVGTDTDGVHQLRDGLFTPLTTQDGLSDDLVMPILEARDGAVWIGTARGLNRLRAGRLQTFGAREGLSDEGVFSLAEDATGRVWVGGERGPLTWFDGARFRPFAVPGLPASLGRVTALFAGTDGTLWVGTDVDGLYRVAGGAATHYTRATGLSDEHVSTVHERPDGSVWIATDQGITVWRQGQLRVYGLQDGLPSPQVRAFHEAGESLWIGTYGGGLCRFRDGRFEVLPAAAGLPDSVVYQILEDGRGDLWMTSNRGIIRVARPDLERAMDGREGSPFTLHDIGDGLKSSTCVGNFQPAGWKARDGRLWFPTRRGAVWVDGTRAPPAQVPPRPLVERVLLDGRPQSPAGPAVAPPGRGDLTVEYTAPSFRNPAALRFRYRLDGLDADWQDAQERRTAHYTNVPPGRYVFRVAAVTPQGVASAGEARLDVEMEPHFYQTAWFYSLGLLAAALAAGGLYTLKLRQVRGAFGAVLAERSRIAREMHDSLDQGFTAISLQLDVCTRIVDGTTPTRGPLRQRLDLAKDLLEYARSEARRSISDLRSEALETGDLVTALGRVAEQFSLGSDLRVGVSVQGRARPLPGAVENNLLRICQEAVANAVRHGQARDVAIGLSFEPEAVRLTVKDAGCGFDTRVAASEREGHFGLMGIRERVKKLGGRLLLESEPGRGTAVLVEIPVGE